MGGPARPDRIRDHPSRPAAGPRRRDGFLAALGPGLVTGAADDDPSGIATYSIVGASLGPALLWTAVWTLPLMAAVELTCARIGLVSGRGLAGAVRHHTPRPLLYAACGLVVVANVFFMAAIVNGLPPLLVLVVLAANSRRIMGSRTNGFWLNALGWTAAAVMTLAGAVFLWHSLTAAR